MLSISNIFYAKDEIHHVCNACDCACAHELDDNFIFTCEHDAMYIVVAGNSWLELCLYHMQSLKNQLTAIIVEKSYNV